jgi:Carbohydrate esterase, sialic acid-specific acetylesterase
MSGSVADRRSWPWALLVCGVLGCGVQAHPTASNSGTSVTQTGGTTGTGTGGTPATGGTGVQPGSGGSPTGGSGGSSVSSTGGQGGSATGGAAGSGQSGTGGSSATGGSSGTGAGVTINGMFVPKDQAVVFIHFGHSNMRGQATMPTSLRPYFYNTQAGLWSYRDGAFTLAKEPTAPEGTMTFAGPGMAILHSAQAALQTGSGVQFISIGYGKGSATTEDYAPGGTYYTAFMTWAKALKGNVTFGAIVIMLGITDGEHLPSADVPGFPMRVSQIVSSIRSDLGEPNLPVLFCDYEQNATGTLAPTGSVGMVMQPLIRMLPGMISNLVLVPTDGLEMQDDHHFDMQGHKDWSDRVVMLMKSNGWYHW